MVDQINTESIGLYIPVIDDRSEEILYQQSLQVVLNRSRGQLSDTSDSGPLGVLLRAQAFATAELLYEVNKLPLALALKLLELAGTVRQLGAKSRAELTFYLTAPRSNAFVIPKGFEVSSTGDARFYTDSVLIIPAGLSSGNVSATSGDVGAVMNMPAYSINQVVQPLAFLASVINIEPSQGGADAESIESAIARGLVTLRSSNPVTTKDFENLAQAAMGSGSRARAIGLLASDKISKQLGAVHLFLLSSTGEPANQALISEVYASISPRIMLGTTLYVSAMEITPISGIVTLKLKEGVNPNSVADSLWFEYQQFLSPTAYEPGSALLIQELQLALRFSFGVSFIESMEVNGRAQNVPMPNDYTLPLAYSLAVNMIDSDGTVIQTTRGAGESIDYDPQP